jgi:hypothetical protein
VRPVSVASSLRRVINLSQPRPRALIEAELRAGATGRTGLADFGPADEFEPGLRQLLPSIAAIDTDGFGAMVLRRALVGALANRLRFVAARAASPQALVEPPRSPLIIAAMPRTGSTLLLDLLAAQPGALSLPFWWAMRPFPPPGAAELAAGGSWSRRAEAGAISAAIAVLAPDQMAKHPITAQGRVEDSHLQMGTFASVQWWGLAPVYDYVAWLGTQDGAGPYAILREHLQLLQAGLPGTHWVLKSPGHFLRLGTLSRAFPATKVVMIHRDPARVVASTHSLLCSGHAITAPAADEDRLHAASLGALADGARHVVETHDSTRILDVAYPELVADPLAVVRRIHAWAGIPQDEAAIARKYHQYTADPSPKHRYASAVRGMAAEAIRERFTAYIERFDVRPE